MQESMPANRDCKSVIGFRDTDYHGSHDDHGIAFRIASYNPIAKQRISI